MQYKYLNPWLAVAARKINKSFFSWKKKKKKNFLRNE